MDSSPLHFLRPRALAGTHEMPRHLREIETISEELPLGSSDGGMLGMSVSVALVDASPTVAPCWLHVARSPYPTTSPSSWALHRPN